jgi:hypothetical protein
VLKDQEGRKKLALLCPASDPCVISGVQLGFVDGVEETLLMENVLIRDSPPGNDEDGALLSIGTGNVTGVNLAFSGGKEATYGGCVFNKGGTFSCTDCTFDGCSTQGGGNGGGVFSQAGTLSLVRASFANNTCSDCDTPWGSGCWCDGAPWNTKGCAGCTCKTRGQSFYCDNGPSSPPPPPPAPPAPPPVCADFSGEWHYGTHYRLRVTQDPGECKLTVTALPHANCGGAPLPPCQVDWVSPAPGYARGRTATVFFCDWDDCTSVWPHPNPAQTWAIISE